QEGNSTGRIFDITLIPTVLGVYRPKPYAFKVWLFAFYRSVYQPSHQQPSGWIVIWSIHRGKTNFNSIYTGLQRQIARNNFTAFLGDLHGVNRGHRKRLIIAPGQFSNPLYTTGALAKEIRLTFHSWAI